MIGNGLNPNAGTTYPILYPFNIPNPSAIINLDLGNPTAHRHQISITENDTTINFLNTIRGRGMRFILDITIDTATFNSITYAPAFENPPTGLPTGNGSRYLLEVEMIKTATEEKYYVVGGSEITGGGGGNVPNGTIENQHIEWNNILMQWEAKANLTFGDTGPHADIGFLRFPNDTVMLASRTGANDGNAELKITTQDEFDFTVSNNTTISLLLRAQHAIDPDNLFLISQQSGNAGDAILTAPNNLAIFTGLVTSNVLFSPTKALFETDISLTGNSLLLDPDEDSGIASALDDRILLFTNNTTKIQIENSLTSFTTDVSIFNGGEFDIISGVNTMQMFYSSLFFVHRIESTNTFAFQVGAANKMWITTNGIEMQGTTDIKLTGAGQGVLDIGRLDFVDNLATPITPLSIYSDGTDLFANTGGGVVNFSDIGNVTFLDSTFRIQGSGDQTKQLAFEVDGLTTSTTRTVTIPDADTNLVLDTLSNLNAGFVAINTSLLADTDGIRDLGSPSFFWDETFSRTIIFKEDKPVDSTETAIGANSSELWLNQTNSGNSIAFRWDDVLSYQFSRTVFATQTPVLAWQMIGISNTFSIDNLSSIMDFKTTLAETFRFIGNNHTKLTLQGIGFTTAGLNDDEILFDSSNSTANDIVGQIHFIGHTDVSSNFDIAKIVAINEVPTNVTRSGLLEFRLSQNGTENDLFMDLAGFANKINFRKQLDMNDNKISDIGEETITDLPTVPAASGDFVWIIDSTDGLNKKVDVIDFLGAGSPQTPILQDIDYEGFDVKDISNVEFRNTTGVPSGGITAIWGQSNNLRFNVSDTNDFDFREEGSSFLIFNSEAFTYTGGTFQANVDVVNLGVNSGDNIFMFGTTNLLAPLDANTNYMQFDATTAPANPPTTERRLFADSVNNNELSVRTSAGITISLESTGGEFFGPWTATHDASGETLDNLGILVSANADPADTGFIQMGNNEFLAWESNPTGTDGLLTFNNSNRFQFNGPLVSLTNLSHSLGVSSVRWNTLFAQTVDLTGGGGAILSATIGSSNTLNATVVSDSLAYFGGVKQTFSPDGTNAGINIGTITGDPSSTVNGDLWYNSTSNKFRTKENGVSVDVIGGGGGSGITSINADATAAQIIAVGVGLDIINAGATHTLSIDSTVVTLTGSQILTNKTMTAGNNTFSGFAIGAEVSGASTDLTDSSSIARNSNNLSFFSPTTSAQLAGVISNETGSGLLVFGTSPTLITPNLATPTIAIFTNATHGHQNAGGGGTLLSTSALSDTANIAYLNTANTFLAGNLNTFAHNATNPGLSILPIAGNPSARANGAIWLNVSTQQLLARINGADVNLGIQGGGGISFPIDFPEDDRGTVGASTQDILFTDSDRHSIKMTITGDVALSFSTPPTNETAYTNVIIAQDGTGGHTLTLPIGTINKDIVEAGFLTDPNLETGIVIKFAFGVFYAFLETGNVVSGGGSFSGNLSDLTINVNKNWQVQGISNVGNLTGVTGIDLDGATALIQGVQLLDLFQANQQIESLSGGIIYDVDSAQSHKFRVNVTDIAEINSNGIELFGNSLILDSDSDTEINSLSDDQMQFITGASLRMTISNTALLPLVPISMSDLNKITNVLDPTNPQDVVTKAYGDANYLGGGGGANTALSNLTNPTSINQDLIPQASKILGDSANRWLTVFTDRIRLTSTTNTIFESSGNMVIDSSGEIQFRIGTINAGKIVDTSLWDFQNATLDNVTDIGTAINIVDNIYADKIRFPSNNSVTVNAHMLGRVDVSGTSTSIMNVPTNEDFMITENGVVGSALLHLDTSADVITIGLNASIIGMNLNDKSIGFVTGNPMSFNSSNGFNFLGGNTSFDNEEITDVNQIDFTTQLGDNVASIIGNDSSPDILEIKLGAANDFLITDDGTPVASFNNTLSRWGFDGADVIRMPIETQLSDRPSAPSTPPNGFANIYVINIAGAQSLRVKFDNGTEKIIADDV